MQGIRQGALSTRSRAAGCWLSALRGGCCWCYRGCSASMVPLRRRAGVVDCALLLSVRRLAATCFQLLSSELRCYRGMYMMCTVGTRLGNVSRWITCPARGDVLSLTRRSLSRRHTDCDNEPCVTALGGCRLFRTPLSRTPVHGAVARHTRRHARAAATAASSASASQLRGATRGARGTGRRHLGSCSGAHASTGARSPRRGRVRLAWSCERTQSTRLTAATTRVTRARDATLCDAARVHRRRRAG